MKPVHKNNLFCYYKMVLLLVIILASMSVLSSINIAMAVFLGLLFAGVSLFSTFLYPLDFPGGLDVKRLPTMRETQVRSSGEGNGNPLQYSCLENPMDGGAW